MINATISLRKVNIPSIAGTDEPGQPYTPTNGAYKNTLVTYESTNSSYLYSSDGVYHKLWSENTGYVYINGKYGDVKIDLSEMKNKNLAEVESYINESINSLPMKSDAKYSTNNAHKNDIEKIILDDVPKKCSGKTTSIVKPRITTDNVVNCRKQCDTKNKCPSGCSTCKDTIFRKVVIPSAMGTDEPGQPYAPKNGAYRNTIVTYEATGISYMYSSDGLYTKIAEIDIDSAVTSVNGKTGDVVLDADDVKALPDSVLYGRRLVASGINVTLKDQNGNNLSTIQTQDTTYTAGTGIDITDNVISSTQTSAEWGNIAGNINDQTDLKNALDNKVAKVTGKGLSTNDYTNADKSKLAGLENYDDTEIRGEIADAQGDISTIEGKIPAQATSSNQLADKAFVNSSLNSITAFYITKDAQGTQFATKAELDATTTFYSGGEVRVPTRNDYCIVLADETKTDPVTGENPTTRYIYQNGWEFQYVVNKTALTASQLAAVNSGATSVLIGQITTNQNDITALDTSKQDVLTPGAGITITESGVISASGGIELVFCPDGLPDEGEENKIYLTWADNVGDYDLCQEYIWLQGEQSEEMGLYGWERLGTVTVDLSDYVNKNYNATNSRMGLIQGTSPSSPFYSGFSMVLSTGEPRCDIRNLLSYNNDSDNLFIGKGTLENIKDDYIKRGLVSNTITLTPQEQVAIKNWIGVSGAGYTAGDNIEITVDDILRTKDSQIVNVDCTSLSSYNVSDEKVYILENISTLTLTTSGNSERHFFIVCGSTAPNISYPSSWGNIPFDENTIVEISVLNGKCLSKGW